MTTVKYDKPESQKKSEKSTIIDVIKKRVPKSVTGRYRGIKLPEYIFFNIENGTLYIAIHEFEATKDDGTSFMKNPTCENMQTDNAAFEGWAICLKCWLDNIVKVKLSWAIPNLKNLHYNRFLYRVTRFADAFPDWFMIDDMNQLEIQMFKSEWCALSNNSYSEEPREKKKKTFGETEMEYLMANKLASQMVSEYNISYIDRQFPVGIKKNGIQFFTGGMSAIDLWGVGKGQLTIIELKYGNKNIKVGIISELFLYSCVMRDIIKGIIKAPDVNTKDTERSFYDTAHGIQTIHAEMLATDFHPLIEKDEVFCLLNSNALEKDVSIRFNKKIYNYDIEKQVLKINPAK